MDLIKILRLKSGEDIICKFEETLSGKIIITDPMVIEVYEQNKVTGLVMYSWLPIQLIEKNEATIDISEMLFQLNPNNEFREYYINSVQKLNDSFKAREIEKSLSEEQKSAIMESLDIINKDQRTFH